MLTFFNFFNWGFGVIFFGVFILCFIGECYCCFGRLLNVRFLVKKRDLGESIFFVVACECVVGGFENDFFIWKLFF